MRLLDATTLEIHEFGSDDQTPDFAILSHTWGEEECSFQHMNQGIASERKGYRKIKLCCEQALKDGLRWAWVDTCCIDKSSTAELSEAINSMFRWYRNAKICYAYLSDTVEVSNISQSRWVTRGWTLQELVAPVKVHFYNADWKLMGSKVELQEVLWQSTNIERSVLVTGEFSAISVARRMSWAANRKTTRVEDQAYCLMGIFDVNMPLLYGEGKKAFTRLQEEIMKVTDDQSLFAWGLPEKIKTIPEYFQAWAVSIGPEPRGLFAHSPAEFTHAHRIRVLNNPHLGFPPIVSNSGVRIELQIAPLNDPQQLPAPFAVLFCTMEGKLDHYLGFPIWTWGGKWTARLGDLVAIAVSDLVPPHFDRPYRDPTTLLIKKPTPISERPSPGTTLKIVDILGPYKDYFFLESVHCSTHAVYSDFDQSIKLAKDSEGLHAVLLFKPVKQGKEIVHILNHPDVEQDFNNFKTGRHEDDLVVGIICFHLNTTLLVVRPPFAILVGGKQDQPWVQIMSVLNDSNTESDFSRLNQLHSDFVSSCATKKQILSLLDSEEAMGLLPERRYRQSKRTVLHWKAGSLRTRNITTIGSHSFTFSDRSENSLVADAQLRLDPSNLVEQNLFLYIEVFLKGDRQQADRKPGWWAQNSIGESTHHGSTQQ